MKRNMQKYVAIGKEKILQYNSYDLKSSEMQQFWEIAKNDIYEAFLTAYHMGVATGMKLQARHGKDNR